ncbi:MAG: hypothetical protein HYZ37_18645 [Candidatus Solibacter usitatus]|nr:hypothetical protein [Candidatus Solibacter usitatus]
MSIGLIIQVHDGIVLAADSASTLTLTTAPIAGGATALNVYNNANKVANLFKGEPIGCVAYGAGSIGSASISTLLKDFRALLACGAGTTFHRESYTMEGVAEALTAFLMEHVRALPAPPANMRKTDLGVLLGGYSKENSGINSSLGEGWMIQIENGEAKPPLQLRKPDEVGITWGGEGDAISRIVLGFSEALPKVLESVVKQTEAVQQLVTMFRNTLQASIVFAPMPIQDAIDLAEWLVHSAIMFSRFKPGAPSVGGPIEIAAITKHEGFKWIRRKHYYAGDINPEYPS